MLIPISDDSSELNDSGELTPANYRKVLKGDIRPSGYRDVSDKIGDFPDLKKLQEYRTQITDAIAKGEYKSDSDVLANWDALIANVTVAQSLSAQLGVEINHRQVLGIKLANGPGSLAATLNHFTTEISAVKKLSNGLSQRHVAGKLLAAAEILGGSIAAAVILNDGKFSEAPAIATGGSGHVVDAENHISRREVAGFPTLSTTLAAARAALGLQKGDDLRAHHIIPFEAINNLNPGAKALLAKSGFLTDNIANLIALPGNEVTQRRLFALSGGTIRLPIHRGPHANYNREVIDSLRGFNDNFNNFNPQQTRNYFNSVTAFYKGRIETGYYGQQIR